MECAQPPLKSIDTLGQNQCPGPSCCDSSNHSVSDKTCAPQSTVVGFMGGRGEYPSYETNYTTLKYSETIRLIYNSSQLNMTQIMEAYWKYAPDPTFQPSTFDTAYNLQIFTTTANQYAIASHSIAAKAKEMNETIYVALRNASEYTFWKAKEEQQQFNYKEGARCQAL